MTSDIRVKIGLDGVQQVQAGAAAAAQSFDKIGSSQGRAGQQTAQLSAQIQDFFVQVQAGGSPLTALIQQGSQLSAVYGGVGNAFRAVTGLLTPAVVAFGSVAAAVGATALAYKQGAAESDAYNRALILTGNIAGTTSGQLKEMAKAQAAIAGTQGKAAEVLAQLAASGQVAAAQLGKAAQAAIALERAGGPAAEETAKKFAELGKSPLQAVVRLNEAENFLTVSVYKQIRALEIQGKTAQAAAVAQTAYADAIQGRGNQLDQRLGTIERGWRSVQDQAKKAWDAMLDIGRENTIEEKLKQTEARIAAQRQRLAGLQNAPQAGNLALTGGAGARSAGGNIDSLIGQRGAQNRALLNQTEAAQQARAEAILTQQAIEQTDKLLAQQAAKAQAAYAVMAAKIKGDIEQIQSALKQGLSSPIEAIEREGSKRGDLLKAELSLLQQQYKVAADTVGGQAQAIGLLGQISAKRIEIANEELATQNKVKEAIYATKRAADEFYRQEAEEAARVIGEDKVKNRDVFNAQFDSVTEYARGIDDANEALALQTQLIGANDQARAVAIERLRIEQEERRKLREIDQRDGLLPEQRDALKAKVSEAAAKSRASAEAKAYLEEYQRIYDDLRSGLTDALIAGGKSARDYLKSLFRNLVLQPILRPFISPIAGVIASATAGSSFADTGGQGAFGQAGTAANLYSAGQKIYEGFSSGFANVGTQATSLYSQFAVSGAGQKLGLSTLTEDAAGNIYLQQTAGSSATGSAFGTAASYAAGAAVGVYGGRAISGGYSAIGGNSGNTAVNVGTAIGAIWSPIGAALGGLIGGVVNRAFGRKAPEVESRYLEGTITGSDFSGSAVQNIVEKGGLFRSDKRYADTQAVTGDLDKALDEGAQQLSALAKKYGDALGLPVTALDSVSAAIKVKITDDAAENTKAITDALTQYADALLGTFAADVEPFRKSGETVAQAIERVGGALIDVNTVLGNLGLTALATSIDGGKAAVALADLFGGAGNFAQASANYYQKFYSEAERADRATAQITDTIAGLGLAVPSTRDAFRALVDAQDLTTASGRNAFATLLGVSDAFDALQTAAGKASRSIEDILQERRGLEEELLRAQGDTVALRNLERDALDASNRSLYDQIKALEDQKTAADAAAEAAEKIAKANEDMANRLRSIATGVDSVIGDFLGGNDLINYQAGRVQQRLAEGGIESTIPGIIGATREDIRALWNTVGVEGQEAILDAYSAWKSLNDALLATPRAVAAYRENTLQQALFDAQVQSLKPTERVSFLKEAESELFARLALDADPVGIAQRLTGVITARLTEEARLTQSVKDLRLDALKDELDATKSLRDVLAGIPQFTSSLRFSDSSPLSARQQLAEAQKLFDSTFIRAQGGDKLAISNLQTNAQALISEAISAYGSGGQAAAVFERTTSMLDQLAAVLGPQLDPQITALEAQVTSLESIDDALGTNGALYEALLRIDATLAARVTGGVVSDRTDTTDSITADLASGIDVTAQITAGVGTATAAGYAALASEIAALKDEIRAVAANTAPVATGVAVDREGFLQVIARLTAIESAQTQLLTEARNPVPV